MIVHISVQRPLSIFHESQYGCRNGRSGVIQLPVLLEKVLKAVVKSILFVRITKKLLTA